MRRQITQNALRVDSLLNEVQKKDRFLHSIQTILRDENLDTTSFVSMQQNVKVTYDTSMLGMSEEEAGFREIVEKEEKYNLTPVSYTHLRIKMVLTSRMRYWNISVNM